MCSARRRNGWRGWGGWLWQDFQRPVAELPKAKDPANGLVEFDCTPESSRISCFLRSEEAQCALKPVLNFASWLLLRDSSDGLLYSSHLIGNLVVYLCAKFEALNPRINEIRSCENGWQTLPEVLTPWFSIPPIFWLSDLVVMFPRASGTIMDNSLHVSSHSFTSWPREIKQPQPHPWNGKFH